MSKSKQVVEYIPPGQTSPVSAKITSRSNPTDLKIVKELLKAQKHHDDTLAFRQAVASPIVQIMGTVVLAEVAEKAGLISDTWAGAIEGGVITMIGLQAIKDYGLIPGGAVASAMGLGALANTPGELPGGYGVWDAISDWLKGSLGLTFLP